MPNNKIFKGGIYYLNKLAGLEVHFSKLPSKNFITKFFAKRELIKMYKDLAKETGPDRIASFIATYGSPNLNNFISSQAIKLSYFQNTPEIPSTVKIFQEDYILPLAVSAEQVRQEGAELKIQSQVRRAQATKRVDEVRAAKAVAAEAGVNLKLFYEVDKRLLKGTFLLSSEILALLPAPELSPKERLLKADLKILDSNGLNISERLARSDNGKKILEELKIFDSSEQLDRFCRYNKARSILGMSYSNNDFAFYHGIEQPFLKTQVTQLEFKKKNLFMKMLEAIEKNEMMSFSSGKSKIFRVPYKAHIAYALVDFDASGSAAKRISFCDGNLPGTRLYKGFGEISFDIDPEKLKSIPDLRGFINTHFKDLRRPLPDGRRKLKEDEFEKAISKIAICDESGKPIIIKKSVPCKTQKRGNCGFKSLDILFRSILNRDGQNDLDTDIAYRDYKDELIEKNIAEILSLAKECVGDPFYPKILQSLQDVFLKALVKGNFELADKIKPILEASEINIAQIKSQKGKNAISLVLEGSSDKKNDIFERCFFYGIRPDSDTLEKYKDAIFYPENLKVLEYLIKEDKIDPNETLNKMMMFPLYQHKLLDEKLGGTLNDMYKSLIKNPRTNLDLAMKHFAFAEKHAELAYVPKLLNVAAMIKKEKTERFATNLSTSKHDKLLEPDHAGKYSDKIYLSENIEILENLVKAEKINPNEAPLPLQRVIYRIAFTSGNPPLNEKLRNVCKLLIADKRTNLDQTFAISAKGEHTYASYAASFQLSDVVEMINKRKLDKNVSTPLSSTRAIQATHLPGNTRLA